ncbi:MAG: ABC transporter permease [Chloroflexota bacterium]
MGPHPGRGRGRLMGDILGWFLDPANLSGPGSIPARLFEHITLSAAALLTATVIALPIGLYIGHTRRFVGVAINAANIGRALPSYALVVMILPISLALSPEYGLDPIPTFVAMTLLAIPAILIGAYAGLRSIDADLVEAARGMGLRERQILAGVEMPLASPIIVGGFRTATLQVIATATIGAIVSGGGLGRFIVDGIHNQDYTTVVGGVILVAGLAIGADLVLAAVQRRVTPRGLRVAARRRAEPPDVAAPIPAPAAPGAT